MYNPVLVNMYFVSLHPNCNLVIQCNLVTRTHSSNDTSTHSDIAGLVMEIGQQQA